MTDNDWKYFIVLVKFGDRSASPKDQFDFKPAANTIARFEQVLRGIKHLYFKTTIHSDDGKTILHLVQAKLDSGKLAELIEQPAMMMAFRKDDYEPQRGSVLRQGDAFFIAEVKGDCVIREFPDADFWFHGMRCLQLP